MTEVQNTPTPVAPPLTDHFHTVPHWTHVSWVSWESLLNVLKLVWFSGGRLEFWDPPRRTHDCWIVTLYSGNRTATRRLTEPGDTLPSHSAWRQDRCVCSDRATTWLLDGHLTGLWLYRHLSLWSEFCKRLQPLSPDWSCSWFLWAGPPVFSFLSVNLWGNVQQIWP